MSFQRKTTFACILLLLTDFLVYFRTLAPVVQFIDSGELAVVCKTLGIAHPTGYPLYTLLGRLFTLLPIRDIIFRVNLFSLLLVCLANLFLFFIVLKLLENESDVTIWAAFLASLVFSFTPTLWSQATSNEVYGLNVFCYNLIICLLLIWREKLQKGGGSKILYLLIFVYGLCFGNHMMIVLLLPAVLFILLCYKKKSLFDPERLLFYIIFFILGLSLYVYLPIRSAQNPLLNWDSPENWLAFKRHVSGWQYKAWMFSASSEQLFSNLGMFGKLFFHNFPLYLLPFTFLGIWKLAVKDRKLLVFFLIFFFFALIYAVNYSIPDIDAYFLGCFLVNVIFVGNGFFFLFQNLRRAKLHQIISAGIIFLFIFFPLVLLKKNYFEQDKSQSYFACDLNSNILRSTKKDGLLLTQLWGHYAPWLYLRYIEFKRPDLVVLSRDLCVYSWYADYVKRNYPQVYRNSEDLIEPYIEEISRYENSQPYDKDIIRERYLNMLDGYLLRNLNQRRIYENLVGEQDVGYMLAKIPEGLVYALKDTLTYYPYDFPDFRLRGVADKNVYRDERTRLFLLVYPLMIGERIRYLQQFRMADEAQALSEKYAKLLQK